MSQGKSGAALATALLSIAISTAPAWADDDIGTEIVDAFEKVYGVHPGFRANHAKGIVTEGSFKATPDAAALSVSPLFSGASIPVTVRFSDSGGFPDVPDGSEGANPHGISIKFKLPNGDESDIVSNSLKFFPVSTGEEFRDLQLAVAASPPSAPKPTKLDAFLQAHPTVGAALATLGIPDSFADEEYYGVDAFIFVDKAGKRQPFRYIITPEHVVHIAPAEAAKKPPNYLMDEIATRLKSGPVTFRLRAQLAEPGDPTKDPTKPWPADRKVAELGTLTVTGAVADSDAVQKQLLFLPGNLTDGIEPSDDPLIDVRDAAYPVSFARRNQ
ncbi:MAG TPA: catalase family peroxidase [Stellaceae bacterium]|nr:catalase family peroxidase [Stellaceae bacterium]